MNVLESAEWSSAVHLTTQLGSLMSNPAQMMYDGRPLLTSFGGHDASWGGKGWSGFLGELNQKLRYHVSFWPSFFQPPNEVVSKDWVDGAFSWNGAW